ncbi:hypothetical protein [Cytobacillus luteolus]|uniref:hypothetical protein n=1 Tax=Litchfieldia luteola TaxID=682179 RepID=UPI0018735594|nr:hypothetical protein [Cytobacillus luteolus]MBP1942252.1 hypothetical protein [Cytobacillus luteolus]
MGFDLLWSMLTATLYSIAKKRRGRCLSKEYVNNRTFLLWECSSGETWIATRTLKVERGVLAVKIKMPRRQVKSEQLSLF